MINKKGKKDRKRTSARLKKAVSTTIIAGALLVPATALGKDKSASRLTIGERIARVQQAIKNRQSKSNGNPDELISRASSKESVPAQWGNWTNWANWNNWGNWGNWLNSWTNWGNF